MSISRRRFFLCAAAAATVGGSRPVRWEWRGSALGGEARIILEGPQDRAEEAASVAAAEIERLERIFSLHRPASEISRLNAAGRLAAPSRDLRAALAACTRWTGLTDGAFNPAVQPLWRCWAREADVDPAAALERVRDARIQIAPGRVALSPGAAVTLNGVAQGIIADRVADLLARRGFAPRLVDAGEMRITGRNRLTVALPKAGLRLGLAETAVATSAPDALILDASGRRHHLFDPRTGESPRWWRSVTVLAPTAAEADALSTAFAVSPADLVGDVAAGLAGVSVFAADADGRVRTFGAADAIARRSRA